MAEEPLEIKIRSSGGEQVVAQFRAVSTGAQQMGVATEQAAQKSTRGMRDTAKAADDLKVAAAALTVGFGMAARAAADETRQRDALNRLYGESADQINELSEAIQDNTNFSNDAARQAAITGATLAQNYELSADQIGVLIQRSADLAQIHGIDLADAMSRVSGAIRGEGEAAELLGLNMSDAAVAAEAASRGLEGWNTTMTEAEKAAFRYELVLEQTTGTMGAAADAADTTAGSVRHLANEAQDAAQSFAAWTGPVGEATAALSDHAVEIAVVGGGLVKLVSGLKEAGAASRIASAALSPGGLVVAAGLATVALVALVDSLGTSYVEAAEDAGRATKALADTINSLGQAGSPRTPLARAWKESFEDAIAPLMAIQGELDQIQSDLDTLGRTPVSSQEEVTARNALLDSLEAEQARLESLAEQYGSTTEIAQEFAETQVALAQILTASGPGADQVLTIAQGFKDALQAGRIDIGEYMNLIQYLAETMGVYDEQAIRAAGATDRVGESVEKTTAITERAVARWQEYDAAIRQARQADIDKTRANEDLIASMSVQANAEADQLARNQQKWTEYDEAVRAANDSRVQSTEAAQDYLDALERERALAQEGAAYMDQAADATSGLGDANTELATALDEVAAANADAHATFRGGAEEITRWEGIVRTGIRALDEFKNIQDGLLSSQDVYNQQYSEYGSQISAIERAQEILNQRREEGIALSKEETELLDGSTAALERLEGGQEDAAIQAGILAARYGENMTAGDRLNATIDGVSGAVDGMTSAVTTLTAVLVELNSTDAEPSVAIAGLDFSVAGLAGVAHLLDAIDGRTANATVNVGANISGAASSVAGLFGGDNMHGGTFAHGGTTRIVAAEAGYERMDFANGGTAYAMRHGYYDVPQGTLITPHPESAARMGQSGGVMSVSINFYGTVSSGNLDEFLAEAERAVRSRFASLGV